MLEESMEFLYSFKNKIIEADDLANNYFFKIKEFSSFFKKNNYFKDYEENFLTILGYSYRLQSAKDRLYFTFQEAIYAIDLDRLLKNENSLKLNTIVYILVLEFLIKDYFEKQIDENIKEKAINVYKKIEEKKAKENKKYHMYQN